MREPRTISKSDHWNGTRFFNPWMGRSTHRGLRDLLKWHLDGGGARWPRWRKSHAKVFRPLTIGETQLAVTFINHASFLVQSRNVNILLDPVYSMRTSPVTWAGPRRVRTPGIAFDSLPPIQVVLVTHCHYDHMDLPTLRRIDQRDQPVFLTGLRNQRHLMSVGIPPDRVRELDWWESVSLHQLDAAFGSVNVTYTPSQHFSARTPWDADRALWGGFCIDFGFSRALFLGDTGYCDIFKDFPNRLGPLDLSFVPIGAYEPRWFMRDSHVNPEEALRLHQDLDSAQSIAMHFGTFQLTDEAIDEPVDRLRNALASEDLPEAEFLIPREGETRIYEGRLLR